MCGITGIVNKSGLPVSQDLVKAMTDSIAHRGPDGEGQWTNGNVGIGHRRLSIIDLTSGASQPFVSRDKRFVLTYNGELYNFRELRKELEGAGVVFRSSSDTEVILQAITYWGLEKAILKFNGMFAFGLWDNLERVLTVARDRFGVKPLYYVDNAMFFMFGSEQRAVIANPEFRKEINFEGMLEYLTFQNFLSDQTLLKGIKLLPAGTYGILDARAGSFLTRRYWDYSFAEPDTVIDERDYLDELDRLLNTAVARQMVGDVEIGSYLSGGVDSGIISSIAAKSYPELKTFTCGFEMAGVQGLEVAFDERRMAAAASRALRTRHHEVILDHSVIQGSVAEVMRHLEEPRIGQSYPNLHVAKLASKSVKVVLSGAGGDELFGGYPWRYYKISRSKNFKQYIDEYYLYWQRLIPNADLKDLTRPIAPEISGVWTRDIFESVFEHHANELKTPADYINHSLYFEAKTFLGSLFVVEDKLAMSQGLEVRVPFMDNDVVDFATRIPISQKINSLTQELRIDENSPGDKKQEYFLKTQDGKRILRSVAKRHLPHDHAEATKQGFSAPDATWFRGGSSEYVKEELLSSDTRLRQYLDHTKMSELVSGHLNGSKNRRLLIWSLLSLESWMSENNF